MPPQSPMFDGKVPHWYHFMCFFSKQRPKSVGDIDKYGTLRYEDQKRIQEKIGERGYVAQCLECVLLSRLLRLSLNFYSTTTTLKCRPVVCRGTTVADAYARSAAVALWHGGPRELRRLRVGMWQRRRLHLFLLFCRA